jgi:hypothetical protein
MTDKGKTFIKAKEGKNQTGPGFRTHDFFKKSRFEGKAVSGNKQTGFNPGLFKTQHKG